MPQPTRLLILTDVRLYRDGLTRLLEEQGVEVTGAAADSDEAARLISHRPPDVILIDMTIPDALASARLLREAAPMVTLVALGVPDAEEEVVKCAEAGIAGYVRREASLAELYDVLESAARGELRCTPRIAGGLLRRVAMLAAADPMFDSGARLTARQREIVRLVDLGLSNKEIAGRLGIELATVKNHVHNILDKLHVHRRGEAAVRVRRSIRWFSARAAEKRNDPLSDR